MKLYTRGKYPLQFAATFAHSDSAGLTVETPSEVIYIPWASLAWMSKPKDDAKTDPPAHEPYRSPF